MTGWLIFAAYMLVGAFWGRIYYNLKMKGDWHYRKDAAATEGVFLSFIWPIWVAYHLVRLSVLFIFRMADLCTGNRQTRGER